ncbi:hypothetical protein GOBAR_AA32851 [Gossypium barbadense]|uniref:Uncharacterized protein n=1 Tax=Gossypium barbadense TaxID=3634 RepID=A0A2P5W9V9_GOSBA|nr:hypothetical protein GOBAR_AA32851 [Gossypium barbadense]
MGFDKGQIWTVLSGLPGLPKKAQRSNQGYSVVLYGLFGLIETRECMQGMLRERFCKGPCVLMGSANGGGNGSP